MIDIVIVDYRLVIYNCFVGINYIICIGFVVIMIIEVEVFRVSGKFFVYLYVGNIFVGDVVGKLFVFGFVYDNKVEFLALVCIIQVYVQVVILIFIVVSYRVLVFYV